MGEDSLGQSIVFKHCTNQQGKQQ